jgi:hypothetical protein
MSITATSNSDPEPEPESAVTLTTGTWQLVPGSHLAIAPGPGAQPVGTTIHDGHVVVAPAIEDFVLHLALGRAGAVRFTGQPVKVEDTGYGCVDWSVDGTITCEEASAPMSLTLGYQGIDRHGGRSWAWFTGRGLISPPGEESREVVADLLFEAPAA